MQLALVDLSLDGGGPPGLSLSQGSGLVESLLKSFLKMHIPRQATGNVTGRTVAWKK